jgi:hypothetical protein
MRASDDDRRRVTDLLEAHYVAGRLNSGELEERIERALRARTLADLDALLADLPSLEAAAHGPTFAGVPDAGPFEWPRRRGHRGHRHRRRERSFRAHVTSYLLVMALLMAIWLLTTPGGYFWPIWPLLGWGIGVASHGLAGWRLAGRESRATPLGVSLS